jgi:predicted sulfurtransferase
MKKLISIIVLFFSLSGISQTVKTNVNAQTFKKLIEEKKFVLIDLRTDDEIKTKGKIKGAIKKAVTIITKNKNPAIINFSLENLPRVAT